MSTEQKWVEAGNSGEGNVTFFNPRQLAEQGFTGMLVEGVFEGYSEEEKQDAKGRKFTSKSYKFVDSEEKPVVINAFGKLNYLMKDIPKGTVCQVYYLGKDGEYHNCKVLHEQLD